MSDEKEPRFSKLLTVFFTIICAVGVFPASVFAADQQVVFGTDAMGNPATVYRPSDVTITVNESVKWVPGNLTDFQIHPLVSDQGLWPVQNDPLLTSYAQRFTTPGVYTYRCGNPMHATNGMVGTVRVSAGDPPSVTASVSKSTVLVGEQVVFSAEGIAAANDKQITKIEWDFDGNATVDSDQRTAATTYATPGIYNAKLTVTDSAGVTTVKEFAVTVSVSTSPVLSLQVTSALSVSFKNLLKKGLTVQATVNQPGAISGKILFGKQAIATAKTAVTQAGTVKLTFKLSKTGRKTISRALKKKRQVKVNLAMSVVNQQGDSKATSTSLTVKKA